MGTRNNHWSVTEKSQLHPWKWTNVTWKGNILKGCFIFQPSILYYQPKQCTIIFREIPQNDHRFVSSLIFPQKWVAFNDPCLGRVSSAAYAPSFQGLSKGSRSVMECQPRVLGCRCKPLCGRPKSSFLALGLQGSKANDRHARCKHRLAAFLLRVPAKARLLVFFVVFQEQCYHLNEIINHFLTHSFFWKGIIHE